MAVSLFPSSLSSLSCLSAPPSFSFLTGLPRNSQLCNILLTSSLFFCSLGGNSWGNGSSGGSGSYGGGGYGGGGGGGGFGGGGDRSEFIFVFPFFAFQSTNLTLTRVSPSFFFCTSSGPTWWQLARTEMGHGLLSSFREELLVRYLFVHTQVISC